MEMFLIAKILINKRERICSIRFLLILSRLKMLTII
ncbi:MAG: hypothetical protein JWQ35_2726 [Bacteriovoracaceae bacterium]|nr:hypothetical protein [Bacteriovoracaceae bacterium]